MPARSIIIMALGALIAIGIVYSLFGRVSEQSAPHTQVMVAGAHVHESGSDREGEAAVLRPRLGADPPQALVRESSAQARRKLQGLDGPSTGDYLPGLDSTRTA